MTPLSLVEKLKLANWLVKQLTGDQFKVAVQAAFLHDRPTFRMPP
jgi:hypothetical protein